MKYYLLNFYQLFKKQYLLILGLYIGLYSILFLTTMGFNVNPIYFNTLLGCPPITNNIQILWILFQMFCHIYIVFIYLTYEWDSSYEYVLLRESAQKILYKKILLMLFITIFLRLMIFIITYCFFYHVISFPLNSFIYNLVIYLVVTLVVGVLLIIRNRLVNKRNSLSS